MPLYDFLLVHPYGSPGDVPTSPDVSYFYRPDINDAAELAAFITVGLAVDSRIDCVFDETLKPFILKSGTADTGDPGQVTPDDANNDTNKVFWQVMG